MTQEMPKDGYQYVEIKFPDKGVELSAAIDDYSVGEIVDVALNAKVDRDYVRKDPATVAVPVEVIKMLESALVLAIGYPALVANGNTNMPILKGRAKDDCDILADAIGKLQPYTKGEK